MLSIFQSAFNMFRTSFSLSSCDIYCFLTMWTGVSSLFYPKVLNQNAAEIEPLSSFVFIGESLRMWCKLNEGTTDVALENMYFEIHSHHKNLIWIVPMENVTVDSNTRAIYTNIEVTEDFSNMTTVACMNETNLLHSVYIYAEHPIQNITNFTGIYYYFNHIDLWWSLGVTYMDINSINVEVDWNPFSAPNMSGNSCSNLKTSCTIDQYRSQGKIFVRFVVSHKFHDKRPSAEFLRPLFDVNATSVHVFDANKYRKTLPPSNLRIVNINTTCVTLTWDHPLYFASCNCTTTYQIIAKEKDNTTVTLVGNGIRQLKQENIDYCSLRPFTSYDVSVKIKGDEVNPWSDPAATNIKTEEDRPMIGPPMTDTSYNTGDCANSKRELFLYWQDPLPDGLQGELTKFEITVNNVNISLRKGSNFLKTDLDCVSEYEILVYSVTKVGSSTKPSKIVVPKNYELPLLKDVTVRMEEVNGTEKSVIITVTWNPGLLRGRNVTLIFYYCQEANVPYTCFNDFTTYETSVNKKEMVLSNLLSSTNLFGYALRDEQGLKRGIEWINCVYRAEIKPGKPTSVNVNPGNLANSLTISWTFSKCDKVSKVLVLRYHIYVCSQKNENLQNFCYNVSVDSTLSTYVAKDLKEGRTYYVYLMAESAAGMGLMSDPVNGTTKIPEVADQNLTSGSTLGIALGVLSGAFTLGMVIFLLLSLCKRSKKQIKTLVTDTHKIWDKEEKILYPNNKESGIGTGSSPTSPSLEEPLTPPNLPLRGLDSVNYGEFAKEIALAVGTCSEMSRNTINETLDNGKGNTLGTPVLNSTLGTPVLNSTVEQSPTHATEDLNDSTNVNMNSSKNVQFENMSPYVMMANAAFSVVSGTSVETIDNPEDNTVCTPVLNSTVEQSPTHVTEDLNDSTNVNMNGSKNMNSDNIIPYVMIANTGFSVVSNTPVEVAIDEGYNSPGAKMDGPSFLENIPQPYNVLMETQISPISPQSQNVLMEAKLSTISPQSQNVVMETKLPPISPQSQNVFMKTKLPPISPQSQNVFKKTQLFSNSSILSNNPVLYVYNVKDDSNLNVQSIGSQLQPSTSNVQVKSDSLKDSFQFNTTNNDIEMHQIKSESVRYEEQNSTSEESAGMSEILENKSDTYKEHTSPGYVFYTVNGTVKNQNSTSEESAGMSEILENKSNTYKEHTSPGYVPCTVNGTVEEQNSTSEESAGMSEILENKSDTYKEHNSPGYVPCTVNGTGNFEIAYSNSEKDSRSLQSIFSGYKSNDQSIGSSSLASSLMEAQTSDSNNNEAYKSIQFIEGAQKVGFGSQMDLNDYFTSDDSQAVTDDLSVQTTDYIRQALAAYDTSQYKTLDV